MRLKHRWLPWVLGVGVLLVWAIIATVLISAYRNEIGPSSDERDIVIADDRLSIELTVPAALAIEAIRTDTRTAECPVPTYLLDGPQADDPSLLLETPPGDCQLGESQNSRIGNGNHGVYRSIDDVAAAMDVQQVKTAVGKATVFTQEYSECAGSCTTFQEPVAIIELADPTSPDYPTLVVHGLGSEATQEGLAQILSTLEPAA